MGGFFNYQNVWLYQKYRYSLLRLIEHCLARLSATQ